MNAQKDNVHNIFTIFFYRLNLAVTAFVQETESLCVCVCVCVCVAISYFFYFSGEKFSIRHQARQQNIFHLYHTTSIRIEDTR